MSAIIKFLLPPIPPGETYDRGMVRRRGASRALAALPWLVALAVVCAVGRAEPPKNASREDTKQKPLVVCAVPDAMPRTGKADDGSPQGLDLAVANLVARELGRPLEVHWCASAACSWKCVHEKRCDVVVGQPHGSGPSREIAWSTAYSGSRFGLVVERGTQAIHSHADLAGKRVGIVAGSLALAAQGHTTVEFKSREKLLEEFSASRLDAAFVDDDFAAWYLHAHPDLPLARVAEYVPRERWNMGFAVRAADAALLKELNRALAGVVLNGLVSKAFSEQGVDYRAPFTNSEGKPLAVNSWKKIRERGEIAVSMDPANLPYSSAKGDRPGFDVELARALADELGVKLRIDWIDIHRKTAVGQLLDGQCDLAFGAAVEPRAVDDEEELAEKVIYSRPYYGTGYFLVKRKGGPSAKSLADLEGEASRRLGAEAGSVADYVLRQQGLLRRLFRTQLSALKSLSDGGIDYAYLWGNVGWTLHASPEFEVEIAPGYVPEHHWNIAIAMRKGDDELKTHVDEAIKKLIDENVVSRALESYHVPYFPAFDSQQAVIRHPPADRGPEPKMNSRQRSKRRYGGLERIRSAGVLVVGLDHNSLPFSAAHPEPAGLDYEIAGLLAEKLDVSLKIFWGYSSHDSYPSKLAAKELCDVMLSVMPDDRFGARVAFSKPYYFSDYRLVIAAGASRPDEKTPLAVERGLALRGIGDRNVHESADLESILRAVALGQEAAGYVSAPRASWLAHQKWPDKLEFIPGEADSVDRFPICAAVRKNEGDLKTAIDRALEEFAQSGKLREVFARWHIPYDAP